MLVNVTPELEELIEARIRDFINNPIYGVEHRAEVAQVHALPLLLDMGGCFALRPNGEIVKWPWDKPEKVVTLQSDNYDLFHQIGVLFIASKSYPELAPFVPDRPAEAQDCNQCNGTGKHPITNYPGCERINCSCFGLGWTLITTRYF